MEDKEDRIRAALSQEYLEITKGSSFMFGNIDSFVALSLWTFIHSIPMREL